AIAAFLESKGLEILERNYTCDVGEIDLVCRDGETLVFCEVKARENERFGHPFEAITPAKQRKIRRVAEMYLLERRLKTPICRLDAVAVRLDRPGDLGIEWAKDAF
ncbi:MAG: YraN family protein, partial [Planctomycetota bacterium]